MSKIRITISMLTLFLLIGCVDQEANGQEAGIITANIEVADFKDKIATLENEQLIDVRTPAEWATGTIAGAKRINWHDANFISQVEKLDKNQPVMVYCASGGRSGKAMQALNEMGFKEVYNLSGGIGAWKNAGYAVEK